MHKLKFIITIRLNICMNNNKNLWNHWSWNAEKQFLPFTKHKCTWHFTQKIWVLFVVQFLHRVASFSGVED